MESVILACEKREKATKSYLRQLRRQGKIPAVVYGRDTGNVNISLDGRTLNKVFNAHGARGIFSLQLGDGKPVMALVREVQRHPISGEVQHVDFLRIRMEDKITATVPVFIQGEDDILSKGGILQAEVKEIEVECLPADLPDSIQVDISHLEIGEKITVGDLEALPGVTILTDPESLIATILAPAKIGEEAPEGEAEAEQAASIDA